MYFHLVLTDLQFLPMLRNKSHQTIVSLKVLYFNITLLILCSRIIGILRSPVLMEVLQL